MRRVKNTIAVLQVGVMIMHFFGCEKEDANLQESSTIIETKGPPVVTWKIGISADLARPSKGCKAGLGVCRKNAVFIELDWHRHIAPINLGVDPDDILIVEFDQNINIEKIAGQNYMEIGNGDEFIDIDSKVIDHFAENDVDISNIILKKGKYNFEYNKERETYYLQIPFIRK